MIIVISAYIPVQLLIIVMKELSRELQLKKIEKNKEAYFSKTLKLGQGAFG